MGSIERSMIQLAFPIGWVQNLEERRRWMQHASSRRALFCRCWTEAMAYHEKRTVRWRLKRWLLWRTTHRSRRL